MNELIQQIGTPTILAVAGGVLICVFALLGSFGKQDKPRRWINWCAFGAGIVVLVAGLLSEIETSRQAHELELKSSKIVALAEQNVELSAKLMAFTTGGDSFCYIWPMLDEISQWQTLMLFHEGDYPLFDVELHIEDRTGTTRLPLMELYKEITASHKENDAAGRARQRDLAGEMQILLSQTKKSIRIGTVSPRTAIELLRIPWPKGDTQEYFIRINTRSAYFTQTIQEKKIGGSWKYSWRVLKHGPKGEHILLKEMLSPEVDIPNN
jgi:hypothetical protein